MSITLDMTFCPNVVGAPTTEQWVYYGSFSLVRAYTTAIQTGYDFWVVVNNSAILYLLYLFFG
ncbi:MAG: hypothetical protein M0P69_07390 [Bacteroidales bacterium]|nr:hypothetical protein [Bacteroidales bacterium]